MSMMGLSASFIAAVSLPLQSPAPAIPPTIPQSSPLDDHATMGVQVNPTESENKS